MVVVMILVRGFLVAVETKNNAVILLIVIAVIMLLWLRWWVVVVVVAVVTSHLSWSLLLLLLAALNLGRARRRTARSCSAGPGARRCQGIGSAEPKPPKVQQPLF